MLNRTPVGLHIPVVQTVVAVQVVGFVVVVAVVVVGQCIVAVAPAVDDVAVEHIPGGKSIQYVV